MMESRARLSGSLSACAALISLAHPATGHGAVPDHVWISVDECPSLQEVSDAFSRVLPTVVLRASPGASSDEVRVQVRDLGTSYRVAVGGDVRTLVDEVRRCTDRAKAAAVVVGLVLDPPFRFEAPSAPKPPAIPS